MRTPLLNARSLAPTINFEIVILSEGRSPQSKDLRLASHPPQPFSGTPPSPLATPPRPPIQPIELLRASKHLQPASPILKDSVVIKAIGKLALAGLAIFALLQCIRPAIPGQPAVAEIQAPPEVRHILETHCYACHSDQRRLSWFDQIVPGYWLVRHDILTARKHLDFSTIGAKPAAAQKAALYEAVTMVQLGAMPLPQFVALHPDARMNPKDLDTIKAYLAPWSRRPLPPQTRPRQRRQPTSPLSPQSLAASPSIHPSRVGSLSARLTAATTRPCASSSATRSPSTPRAPATSLPGRRRTLRQDRMAAAGRLDGLIHPGNFVQVELMDKDASRYKSPDGWGWGRWRGLDLKPYGSDAAYIAECTGCHQPVRGDDYV